jgi:tetratricopeptide (TPR) repeat protein
VSNSRILLFCGAALLGAMLGCSSNEEATPAAKSTANQRVKNFWTSFREANRLRTEGKFEEAATVYIECREQDPQHEETLFYLGVTLEQCGRYNEAAEAYRELLQVNPRSGRGLSQLASLIATPAPGAATDFPAAEELLRRLIEVNREQAGPFLQLGWLALNRGDAKSASDDFMLAAESGSAEGFAWAGFTDYVQGRRQQAAERFARPIEIQRKERELAGAGIRSEGDVLPAPDKPLSALDRAALISEFFLHPPMDADASFESVGPEALRRGGGGAWGDFDGDGMPDLAIAGKRLELYRNAGGSFADVTRTAGLSGVACAEQPVWVDYDSDTRLDLYASCGSGPMLYRNLGDGRFADATEAAGLAGDRSISKAVFFDADGDGTPDLVEATDSDVRLYLNSSGRFAVQDTSSWSCGSTATDVAAADFNGDGRADLAIVCWREGVRILLNQTGSWEEHEVGAVGTDSHGLVAFDYDRDGRPDLLVTSRAPWEDALRNLFQPEFNRPPSQPRLFRNTGEGHFEDVTTAMGLNRSCGTMQAVAADFDGDQWVDLLLANGSPDALRLEPSVFLRNDSGKRFTTQAHLPGPGNLVSTSAADFDGDGDVDLYLGGNPLLPNSSGAVGVLRNTAR